MHVGFQRERWKGPKIISGCKLAGQERTLIAKRKDSRSDPASSLCEDICRRGFVEKLRAKCLSKEDLCSSYLEIISGEDLRSRHQVSAQDLHTRSLGILGHPVDFGHLHIFQPSNMISPSGRGFSSSQSVSPPRQNKIKKIADSSDVEMTCI